MARGLERGAETAAQRCAVLARGLPPNQLNPVTQLALLLALGLIGFALSFAFGRLEVKRNPVSTTVKRAEGALERAALLVLRLSAGRVSAALVVPALGLTAFSLFGKAPGLLSSVGRAVFLCLALVMGAVSTLVHARFALGLGARAASSATAALSRGSALAMRPLLRASVAIAVFGDTLGILGVASAFACVYAIRGGFAGTEPNGVLAAEVAALLPAFALGAAVAGLVLAREGSVAKSSADMGGSIGAELGPAAETGDARDPALLAKLMGHLVGELLPRTLSSYVCGLTITVSAARLAVLETSVSGAGAISCLVLVSLVRAFGGLGSVCGALSARVTDEEPAPRGLGRGLLSAFVVTAFGLGAALFWLERAHFLPLLGAGLLGLSMMTIVGQAAWLPLRRSSSARGLSDGRENGEAAIIVRGAGASVGSWLPALVVPALGLAIAERSSSESVTPTLVALTFVAGALALEPFALALSGFGLLATHARGVAALSRLELETPKRLQALDDASARGKIAGSTHSSLALALSALLGLLPLGSGAARSDGVPLGLGSLALGLGMALVLAFGARATQSALQGARLVASEVERQLREFPQPAGAPADFTPSYKPCVEAAFAAARSTSLSELLLLLLAPFLLGSLLFWGGAAGSAPALAGFGVAAVLVGLILTLGGRATRAVLREVRRRARSDASSAPVAQQAQSFGDLVGVTTASSVEALALVLALTVLCLAPLLR